MGSHFVTLYVCPLEKVRAMVGSHDRDLLHQIDKDRRKEQEQALNELIDGTYKKEENPRAGALIRAFEQLCKSASTHSVNIEMYDDEEEAPLLWRLCWEGEDSIELPMSDDGTPALTYHSPDGTQALLKNFRSFNAAVVTRRGIWVKIRSRILSRRLRRQTPQRAGYSDSSNIDVGRPILVRRKLIRL